MVCLGNICRSPLAEGILQAKVDREGLNVDVDSAGTSNFHIDEKPDSRMIKTALTFGISIDHLRGRQFSQADFDIFDIIYAMDQSNYKNIIALARTDRDRNKVRLILNELYPDSDQQVPDPYFGGEEGFVEVYTMLDKATEVIIEKIKQNELR